MGNKVRITELVQPGNFYQEAAKKASMDDVPEVQLKKFEEMITKKVLEAVEINAGETLLAGDSIEFKHMFNVSAKESTARFVPGTDKKKKYMSVLLRAAFNRKLNN